jgi:hypothetical protein
MRRSPVATVAIAAALFAALFAGVLFTLVGLTPSLASALEEPTPSATTVTTTATASVTPMPTATPSSEPTDVASDVPDEAFEVTDAVLRWGVNHESNNRGAAPGTFNFFSAGKLGNPGGGGQLLTDASGGDLWANDRSAGWTAASGNVRIEKLQPDGSYATATWPGLKTDRDGASLGGYAVSTRFSDHQVVLTGGVGVVDPAAGSATISWDGDFTIVYYSGYSFFYVSDPVLTVTDGIGQLTGTLSGYASDMDDMTQWSAVPAKPGVVLADLGTVRLGTDLGFTATPKYLGIRVAGVDQNTSGPLTGSFPQSFIDFAKTVGIAGYWHSTGGGVDKNKPPLDLAVGYSAGNPIIPTAPDDDDSEPPEVDNSAPAPPHSSTSPTPSPVPVPVQPAGPALPLQTPPAMVPSAVQTVGAVAAGARPAATVLPASATTSAADESSLQGVWWAGAAALVLAALISLSPGIYQLVQRNTRAPSRSVGQPNSTP